MTTSRQLSLTQGQSSKNYAIKRNNYVPYLSHLYCRARTEARQSAVRERMLSIALTENPQRDLAIDQLKKLGVHVALTPYGVTIGFAGVPARRAE